MKILRLLGSKVAIRPEMESETESGIVLAVDQKTMRGTVVAIGPGDLNDKGHFVETSYSVGDYVVFTKEAGEEQTIDGDTLLFMHEDSILVAIKDSE